MCTSVTKTPLSHPIHLPARILSVGTQPSTLTGRSHAKTTQGLKGHEGPIRTTAMCTHSWLDNSHPLNWSLLPLFPVQIARSPEIYEYFLWGPAGVAQALETHSHTTQSS